MKRPSALLVPALIAASLSASAAEPRYPTRPIRLIVPFSPGGAADVPARIVAQKLADALGQQMVIDNRPGAGGSIGMELVARAQPDGYTLLAMGNTHFVAATLHQKSLTHHPVDAYAPVTLFAASPNVLVVHPSFEAKTVKELVAMARAAPAKIDFASSGNGSTQHLLGSLFMTLTGVKLTHIPYKGSGPATADLLAGQVKVGFPGIAIALPHVKTGKLRGLGISSPARSPELPDVPTIAEAGVPGYSATQWLGFAGPLGLPPSVVARLFAETHKTVRLPEVAKGLLATGNEVLLSDSPAQFRAFMQEESVKWARMVKESGAQIN